MTGALWSKSIREGRWLLLGCSVLMLVYAWINVWLLPQIKVYQLRKILINIPEMLQKLLPMPIEVMISATGRLASSFEYPLMLIALSAWAISRGSDSVSGEISRGTMEMLLSQPVRRSQVLMIQILTTVLGLVLLASSAWLGLVLGIFMIELDESVNPWMLVPSAINLFSLGVFIGGLATFFSSLDRYRSRTIGIVVAILLVQLLLKIIARTADDFQWLQYATMFTCFEPVKVSYHFWPGMADAIARGPWILSLQYNGVLLGLGLLGYTAAMFIFCRRDLPAPL